MKLIFPAEFYQWAAEHPMAWWHASARWAMGRVAPGLPGEVLDADGEPTGNLVMSHPDIDKWDQAIMAVCVAGWRYALTLGEDGAALAAYQAEKDAAALAALLNRVDAGEISKTDAEDVIRAEIRRQAAALEVDIAFVDVVEEVETIQLERPSVNDLKAEWVAYAEQEGIDTTDLTKDEVIAAVEAVQ